MTTATWKIEKDLCRCCHAEGSFKHLADPCFHIGQEEIYSQMLQECLDIRIFPVIGLLSDITYTICESCIVRLRDAYNFKRQVQDCEERFNDMYEKNLIKGLNVAMKEEPDPDPDDMKLEFSQLHDDDDDDDDEDGLKMRFDDEEEGRAGGELDASTGRLRRQRTRAKTKEKKTTRKVRAKKTIKEEDGDAAEAASSADKKKGDNRSTITQEEDGTKTYTCNTCGGAFKKPNHFSQHYRHVHLKLRPKLRSCYLCDMKVPAHMRAFHLEKVHGWPAPSCGACGKKFAYPFQVLKHQKIYHMGEKSYRCEVCSMCFASKYRLEQHAIKHTSMRKHKCDFCDKAFRWKNNLKTHVMVHLNDKRHVCSVCNEAFVQQSSLKYHIGRRHPDYTVPVIKIENVS